MKAYSAERKEAVLRWMMAPENKAGKLCSLAISAPTKKTSVWPMAKFAPQSPAPRALFAWLPLVAAVLAAVADPFPRRIARAFEQRFGVKGVEVWGMTEIGVPCWSPLDEPLREGSCGKVDSDWYEFRVVDPDTDEPLERGKIGEFVVRPKWPWSTMQGYMGMPDKTVAAWRNLWFHTGDAGYQDHDGYVYFVDRTTERIRRRAENISSQDIEAAALLHPLVDAAAAVGVPSEYAYDDDIKLCIVRHGSEVLGEVDLLAHLVAHLPHYMVPRYIEFLHELPRTATNKIKRSALKAPPYGVDVWDRKAAGISIRELAQQARLQSR